MIREAIRTTVRAFTHHWPIEKGKGRLVESTRRWTASDKPLVATVGSGYQMELDLTDLMQRVIYFFGYYEPMFANYLSRTLSAGDVFVDCGANIGQFSLIASKKVGERGKVISIEPEPANFRQLNRNLFGLNRASNASTIQTALGDHTGKVDFFVRSAEEGFTNRGVHSLQPHADWVKPIKITTDLQTLDNILASEPRIDFMKLDVEGAELSALKGAKKTLERCSPVLFIEANEICANYFGHSTRDIKDWLRSENYHVSRLEDGVLSDAGDEVEADSMLVASPGKKTANGA